jgi:hypothetical protein
VFTRAVSLVLVAALAGCGGSRTTPVEGVVLLDGKPLPNASVQFVPQGAGRDATGQTDASGAFSMSTSQPGDGVVPGEYKVVISPPLGTPDLGRYASSEEAMAAAAKAPPPKASSFPQQYTRPDQTPLTQKVPVSGKVTFELKSK